MATPPPYAPDRDRYAGFESGTTFRRCGRSGLDLPVISLGLWHNFGDDRPLDTQRATLRRAFDRGVTHFDLANNYGPPYGSAEANFGTLFAQDFRPFRDELILSTKAGYDMWPGPTGRAAAAASTCSPAWTSRCAGWALDYVDIFYSHRFDPTRRSRRRWGRSTPPSAPGKALYAGISSYGPDRTREAVRDPARAGHAAADPPAVVLDAQPLDRGGAARRPRGDRAWAASPSRRSRRAC